MNLYRPVITADQYAAFEAALKTSLQYADVSAIGFFGAIGSMTKLKASVSGRSNGDLFGHDIDLVIFPEPAAKLGQTMAQTDELFYTLDEVLTRDHGLTLSPSGRKIRQEQNWCAVREATGDYPLMVHRLIYPDKPSFMLREPPGFFDFAKSEAMPFVGSWDAVERNPVRGDAAVDAHYWLEWYDLSSNCTPLRMKRDPALYLMEMESAVDYLRKRSGVPIDKACIDPARCPSPADIVKFVRQVRSAIDERLAA